MKTNISFWPLALGLLAFDLASAWATPITITAGNPGNAGTDNVLFNDGSLTHSGTLVQGNFSGSGLGFIVDFTSSSGNNMIEGSGGQATIAGLTGNNPFTSLTFGLEGGVTFTKAILNADATGNGMIDFTVAFIDALGSPHLETFSLDGSGQNFFGIEAGMGALITQITISTTDTSFQDANQFRLGGFAPPSVTVPDGGATLLLLSASLSSLELFRRKLLKRSSAA